MMTWMTRMSLFDTADDLDLDRAAECAIDGAQLAHHLIYADGEEEGFDQRHPVARMWRGYEVALAAYVGVMNLRLVALGVTTRSATMATANEVRELRREVDAPFVSPPWLEDTVVLSSHRSNMQRRWPEAFGDTWRGTPDRLPYIWPFTDEEGGYALFLSKADKELLAAGKRQLPTKIAERISNL